MNETKPAGRWTARLLYTAVTLIILGALLGQAGSQPFQSMLALTFGTLLLIIALIMALVRLFRHGAGSLNGAAKAALVLGLLALLNTGRYSMSGGGPPIHDISTDLQNPPEFVVVAELRGPKDNPAEYLDDGTAEQQAQAYPDIQPVILDMNAALAYTAALDAAQAMGWEIVADSSAEGLIEATASTPFVGFKDDIVIRVTPEDTGARVDVRSKSRIGKGDMGVNAKRVREYCALLTNS